MSQTSCPIAHTPMLPPTNRHKVTLARLRQPRPRPCAQAERQRTDAASPDGARCVRVTQVNACVWEGKE